MIGCLAAYGTKNAVQIAKAIGMSRQYVAMQRDSVLSELRESRRPYYYDPYYEAFYNLRSYNEMCYVCPYACCDRTGDLTVGDYHWGSKYHEELGAQTGGKAYAISCILVNTAKGEEALRKITDLMVLAETRFEWITERNKSLIQPQDRPACRDRFYQNIHDIGYAEWARKYFISKDFLLHKEWVRHLLGIRNKLQSLSSSFGKTG